ncbi:MAG: alpha-galactosidase [Firmicutes bacterium]|nr:alpha-galactosidase [Bacillota bacterium]
MLNNLKFHLIYKTKEKNNKITFTESFSNNTLKAKIIYDEKKEYEKLSLSIVPNEEIEIIELFATMDYTFKSNEKIFVNGYQSWTDSKEFFIDEKIKGISKLAKPIIKKYKLNKYGDYTFKKYSNKSGEFHGYTYSYIRNNDNFNLIGSLTEKSGYTIIEEYTKKNKIIIRKDCKNLYISKEYIPYELVWINGTENQVFDKYFDLMNIKKPTNNKLSGWTSWYNYYENINEDIILKNLENFKSFNKNIDIFQIDDGYQTAVGDWLLVDKNKFPKGMKYIRDKIKSKGYKAGIWLAPFVCEKDSIIFKEKKHWLLRDKKNQLVCAGSNWSNFYALDIYNPEVRDYLKKVFEVILETWGFDMVKLDFLYAAALISRKYKPRGQVMTEGMEFLRDCVKDKLILGCGVPLGPSFGLVDYCRIGCDVGLDWDDKFYMKLLHRERVSTLNAIRNTIERRHLNKRAFINDPDVFLLRDENLSLTDIQKETLMFVNKLFGGLIFTSDNIKEYDDKKHRLFDNMMNLRKRKILKVESNKNNLIKVLYIEDKKRYTALINLSNSSVTYSKDNLNINIKPFETKILGELV